MTEADWQASSDLEAMLNWLRGQGQTSERKARLFACACVRQGWEALADEQGRTAVEVAERFADGQISRSELARAWDATGRTATVARPPAWYGTKVGRRRFAWDIAREAAAAAAYRMARSTGPGGPFPPAPVALAILRSYAAFAAALAPAKQSQAALLRDLLGPLPFRRVPVEPTWLAGNGGIVLRLAEGAYENRRLPEGALDKDRLAILADALEEAGCAEQEILGHLRGPGPHHRGCWVVDAVLGRG